MVFVHFDMVEAGELLLLGRELGFDLPERWNLFRLEGTIARLRGATSLFIYYFVTFQNVDYNK